MRLQISQQKRINKLVHQHLGSHCCAYLFGSRIHDDARGGDVDILIKTTGVVSKLTQARLKSQLEQQLGLPVDVVISSPDNQNTPFISIAESQAIPLTEREVA
jgi:predicted nucleotidyltransferase